MSGGTTISTVSPRLGGLQLQNTGYGVAIPIVYGMTRIPIVLIEYCNFLATAHTSTQSTGGKGGGVTTSNTTYTYSAAVIMALCEGPINLVGKVWVDKDTYLSWADPSLNFTVFAGGYPQTPWAFMTSYTPTTGDSGGATGTGSRALGYQGICYAACATYNLGASASLGNHSFEVFGVSNGLPNYVSGYDVNIVDVIGDILANVNYGLGGSIQVNSLTQAATYAKANGILVSAHIDTQKPAAEWLKKFAQIANCALVWSGGKLSVIPYGDTSVTGNGATYTPQITPQYNLTDDDFQPNSGGDPVQVTRKRQADAFNSLKIEYKNRNSNYNIETAEVTDQSNVEIFGQRSMQPVSMREICVPSIAKLVAQTILQRELYVRNVYTFVLTWKYCLLEPMDVVQISDDNLGLVQTPVRILSIEENYDGLLTVTAEEMPVGISQPVQYPNASGSSYQPNFNVAAPAAATPFIFAPPNDLLTTNVYEIWMAATGSAAGWGGCNVWLSSDNVTYAQVGVMYGASRKGTLTSILASHVDPDTVDTLAVDISPSFGQLLSGTTADADAYHTLCYVDGELISYATATLTSAYHYNLTYLRRGAYNTVIGAHAIGSNFARLDDAIFKLPVTVDQIGKTVWIKLQSFNNYQGGLQGLAAVSATSFTLPSPPPPNTPTGGSAVVSADRITLAWGANLSPNFKQFEVRFGSVWATAVYVGTVNATTIKVLPQLAGTYTWLVKAMDVIGQYSTSALTISTTITTSTAIPPGAGTFYATFQGANVVLNWAAPASQFSIVSYEVRYGGTTWATASSFTIGSPTTVNATTFSTVAAWIGARNFWVSATDSAGNSSVPAFPLVVTVTAALAPAITQQVVDNNVLLYWTQVAGTLPTDTYEVRKGGADWSTATVIGRKAGGFTTVFETQAGTYTYRVAAVDSAGNIGAAGLVVATVAQPPDYVLKTNIFSLYTGGVWTYMSTADHGADVTVVGNRVTATGVTNGVARSATSAAASSKKYFEVVVGQVTTPASWRVGIALSTAPLTVLGSTTASWAYTAAGQIINNNVAAQTGLTALVAGSVLGVALDLTGNTLTFFVNGAQVGTPQAIAASQIWFAALNVNVIGDYGTANFGETAWLYSSPEGYLGASASSVANGALVAPVDRGESWTTHFSSIRVSALTVVAGGSGYLIGDRIRLTTGTFTTAAYATVLTVSGTAIATLQLDHCGKYSVAPTAAGATAANTGVGAGCTVTATSGTWASPSAQIAAGYPIYIEPVVDAGVYEEFVDYGSVLAASRVTAAWAGVTINGAPTITCDISTSLDGVTYTTFPGQTSVYASNFRYAKATLKVNSYGGQSIYQVNSLNVVIDAKLINDAGATACLSTDVSGTIANFNIQFVDVQSLTLTPNNVTAGASAAGLVAVYDFYDVISSTTYALVSNVVTVTHTAHPFITGQKIRFMPYSGSGVLAGVYTITGYAANTYTFNYTAANTSGNASVYPESCRIYLFNMAGTRVSGTCSWAIKGY